MSKADDILAEAQRLAETSTTWADLSNALFDPLDGLVSKRYPDHAQRVEFHKTDTYDKLYKLVQRKMDETGIVAGAEPTKSGRFVVRLPKSLHAALEQEAVAEGTSLNQLVLTKLAVRLSTMVAEKGKGARKVPR